MKTSLQLLDEARAALEKHNKSATWYRLAKELDMSDQAMWNYRKKNHVLPLEQSLKLCELLPYNEAEIIYWWALERSKLLEKNPFPAGRARIEKYLSELPKKDPEKNSAQG